MKPDLLMSFGRMFPDYIHPALADGAEGIAQLVEASREPMTQPVPSVEVTSFVAEFYRGIEAQTSSRSFPRLGESGIQDAGHYLTLDTLVSHSADDAYSECSLSAILEPVVAPKYFLSPRACAGILRRAEKRGRELPRALMEALTQIAKQKKED